MKKALASIILAILSMNVAANWTVGVVKKGDLLWFASSSSVCPSWKTITTPNVL